jgi:hypothetical protein
MEVKLIARLRKLLEGIDAGSPGDDEQATLSGQLEHMVAFGASPYEEIVRLGRAFYVNTTAAVAAAVAIPTVTGGLSLYNNEPDGGRSYFIDWVAASNVASAATAAQAQMLAMVGQLRETAPADSGLTNKKMNGMGGGSSDSKSRTILTGTALPATTGLATNWFPIGPSQIKNSAVATPGYGLWVPVDGRLVISPGRYFSTHVLANVVGETFQLFIGWHERQVVLG